MTTSLSQRNRLRDAPAWVHLVACLSFGAVALGWVIAYYVYRDTDVWSTWLNSDGARRWPAGTETHFNERISPASIFRTPSNTFSNLGYVFVGFYILAYALYDFLRPTSSNDPYAVRTPWLMAFFGFYCVGLGFGSGFMHASLTGIGGWWDVYFMFGSLVAMIALHWGRILPEIPLGTFRLPTWPLLMLIAVPVSYFVKEMHGPYSDIQIMAGLIGTIITGFLVDFVLRQRSIQHRWHILAVLSFFLAFGLWNLTNANRFTHPDAYIQGHAIWHVLTACTLGFMGILYRCEVPVTAPEPAQVLEPAYESAAG